MCSVCSVCSELSPLSRVSAGQLGPALGGREVRHSLRVVSERDEIQLRVGQGVFTRIYVRCLSFQNATYRKMKPHCSVPTARLALATAHSTTTLLLHPATHACHRLGHASSIHHRRPPPSLPRRSGLFGFRVPLPWLAGWPKRPKLKLANLSICRARRTPRGIVSS